MIILDEEDPSSPTERSPLKSGNQSPTTPYAPAPPPPYLPSAVPAPIPPYRADEDVEQQLSESDHSDHTGSPHRRGRGGRGRGRGPGRGHGRGRGRGGGRRRSHSPTPERLALRRFVRAFIVALLIILLWGAFLDSVDMLYRARGSKHRHGILSKSQWLITWYTNSTVIPHPCSCPPQSIPTMPGRALPIQYPPMISQIGIDPTLPTPVTKE